MTNKIELEFGSINYQGSKIFSSLADVLGLSVDLVSIVKRDSLKRKTKTIPFSHPPEKSVPSHYCMKRKEKLPPLGPHRRFRGKYKICRHAQIAKEENKQKDQTMMQKPCAAVGAKP